MAHKIKFKAGEVVRYEGMTAVVQKPAKTDDNWVWIRLPVPIRKIEKRGY
jgi:hypothetical protein